MAELLSSLVGRAGDDAHPLLARRTTGRKRLVIITADKGLCGAFNSNILRASLALPAREQGPSTSRWWWWARRRATSIAAGSGR